MFDLDRAPTSLERHSSDMQRDSSTIYTEATSSELPARATSAYNDSGTMGYTFTPNETSTGAAEVCDPTATFVRFYPRPYPAGQRDDSTRVRTMRGATTTHSDTYVVGRLLQ